MSPRLAVLVCCAVPCAAGDYKPATLLDYQHNHVCVETHQPDRILIGTLPSGRKSPHLTLFVGKNVMVQFDDRDLWLRPPRQRTVRFQQDYLTAAFPANTPCEAVVDAAKARLNAPPKELHTRPAK